MFPSLNFIRTGGVEFKYSKYRVIDSGEYLALSEHANKLEIENRKLKLELESLKEKYDMEPKLIKKCFMENTKKLTNLLYKQQHIDKKLSYTDPNKFIKMLEEHDESLVNMFYESLDPESKIKDLEKLKLRTMILLYHLAGLRNQCINNFKQSLTTFAVKSGLTQNAMNLMSNLGYMSSYQTVYLSTVDVVKRHDDNIREY